MAEPIDVGAIRELLPGSWHLSATNFPMWVNGSRRNPELEYALRSEVPLVFTDRVRYTDDRGRQRVVTGTDRWAGDRFSWRGAGALGVRRSRWSISWLFDDLLVLHFEQSRATPAGTNVAIRAGSEHPELRRRIAGDAAGFGLTLEQFASLSWLDHIPSL